MRVGQNPAKQINTVAKPQRITIAVLNYIPYQQGYFAESFPVLQRCLDSIFENTEQPYDLMIFDNGSCPEVKQYLLELQTAGRIQYLIFSEKNVGKGGAWDFIFNAAPGEIIAYSDNDAYFYPGWLKESVKILETYPKVGMITARPLRTIPELSTNTVGWAKETPEVSVEEGDFVSYAEYYEFSSTLGYSDEKLEQEYKNKKDIRLTYKGIQAFVGANHFQFIGWKKTLQAITPFEMQKPLGQVKQLDDRLNTGGYLRLMTAKPFIQNMSNRIPETINKTEAVPPKRAFRIKNISVIKKTLLWIHDRIFTLYYDK
jgi:glycosyltransferase involved in cell wall biosynthesis